MAPQRVIRSGVLYHLRPTLRTEFGRGFDMRVALGTLVLGPQRLAAFGTELAGGGGTAVRARRRPLDAQVHPAGLVMGLSFDAELLHRHLRLRGGGFLVQVRGAKLAETALLVPADFGADPLAASGALLEMRPGLLDGA